MPPHRSPTSQFRCLRSARPPAIDTALRGSKCIADVLVACEPLIIHNSQTLSRQSVGSLRPRVTGGSATDRKQTIYGDSSAISSTIASPTTAWWASTNRSTPHCAHPARHRAGHADRPSTTTSSSRGTATRNHRVHLRTRRSCDQDLGQPACPLIARKRI